MRRLKALWRFLNLPCRHFAHLASESLDRDLSRVDHAALSLHTVYCWACRRYLHQIRLLQRAMSQFALRLETDDALPGPGLPPEIRERIQRSLREG